MCKSLKILVILFVTLALLSFTTALSIEEKFVQDLLANPDKGSIPKIEITGADELMETLFCTDTDSANPALKGTVNYNLGSFTDGCFNATSVAEMYCNNSLPYTELRSCESACFIGACLPTPLPLCYDSDNRNHSEKGVARYFGAKENGLDYPDGCRGPEAAVEYYCDNDWVTTEEFPCEYGCFEGVCKPKPAPQCTDSDADEKHPDGKNLLLIGNATYYGGTYPEICNNLTTAIETSCVNDVLKLDFIGCRLGCSAGICIQNPPMIATAVKYNRLLGWYSFDEDKEKFHGLDSSIFPIDLVPLGEEAKIVVEDNNPSVYLGGATYFELHPGKFPFPYLYPEIPEKNETTDYDFTFSVWFKTDASGVILGQTGKILPPNIPFQGTIPAVYIDNKGKLRTSVFWDGFPPEGSDDKRYVSPVALNDNTWHNVVVTYGQGEENVYLEGIKVNTRNFNQTGYASEYAYTLGTGYTYQTSSTPPGWNNYKGYLDKVLFFQQAMTVTEVKQLYSEGRAGVTPPPFIPPQPPTPPPVTGGGGGGSSSGGGGPSGAGGGGSTIALPKIYTINQTQFVSGFTILIKEGEKIIFPLQKETHTLTLLKINSENKEGYLEIASTPKYLFLKENSTEKMSLTNETFFDIALTANKVTNTTLNITLKSINESVLPPLPSISPSPITGAATSDILPSTGSALLFIAIAFVIIIIYLSFQKCFPEKRKR